MKQVAKTQNSPESEFIYNSYIADFKREGNTIRIKYFSGEEKVLPYSDETMDELNREAIRQIRELVSDIPFVTRLRNFGIVATALALIPAFDSKTDSMTIGKTAALIGLASVLALLSFLLSDDVNERRKGRIFLSIEPNLEKHYDDLKHLKSYQTKGELNAGNLDKYTLREVKRIDAELDDISPRSQAKKKALMKKYGITGIKN